jgi:hypothetical protein
MSIAECHTATEAKIARSIKSNLSHTDEWTSVKESLPPIGRRVLVDYRPSGTEACAEDHRTVEMATFQYEPYTGKVVCRLIGFDGINVGVTVWRDLPELPRSKPE